MERGRGRGIQKLVARVILVVAVLRFLLRHTCRNKLLCVDVNVIVLHHTYCTAVPL